MDHNEDKIDEQDDYVHDDGIHDYKAQTAQGNYIL